MNYMDFHHRHHCDGCFSLAAALADEPTLAPADIAAWLDCGDIVCLDPVAELFAFATWLNFPDAALYFAGRIRPGSYVSMQTALALGGYLADDSPRCIRSVGPGPAAQIDNAFADYRYAAAPDSLLFGYGHISVMDSRPVAMACPEKALLDLLLFDPDAADALRFDRMRMLARFDWSRLARFEQSIASPALSTRLAALLRRLGI